MRSSKFVNKAVLLFCMLISSALDAVDFNKDGIDDLVFKSDDGYLKTWELDTSLSKTERWLINLGSPSWNVYANVGDLDNDGNYDILVQDESTGYIKAIKMSGFDKDSLKWVVNPGDSDWQILDVTNIDSDSYPEIILQNSSNGYIKAYKFSASFAITSQWIGNPGADWKVTDIKDIDGDGIDDLVFRHQVLGYIKAYKLNSDFTKTEKWIGNPGGSDWEVKYVADIDGDGISDIVLQNRSNGYIKAYRLNFDFSKTEEWIGNPGGSDWEVKYVADIDGDGIKDITIQNRSNGYIKAYQVSSSFTSTSKWIGNPNGVDWSVAKVSDINGDGQADILLQNTTNGYVKAYDVSSTFSATSIWIGNAGSSWNISESGTWKTVSNDTQTTTTTQTDIFSSVARVPHTKSSIPMLGVLISYNDVSISFSDSIWSSKLFGKNENGLNHYYAEVSNSKFELDKVSESSGSLNDGIVSVSLNKNHPDISVDSSLYNTYVHKDLRDALIAVDSSIDFSNYDFDANGYITPDELLITFVMAGYEDSYEGSHVQYGTWGHQYCIDNSLAPTLDGVSLMNCSGSGNYAIFGELHDVSDPHGATIGIIAHELGHSAFSLPDLYNVSSSFGGIGNFGAMGGGTWATKDYGEYAGATPIHFSAWSKVYMGWVTPTEGIGSEVLYETSSSNYNVVQISINEDEYYLLENRNNSGYDRGLFSLNGDFDGGIALWHINKNKLTQEHFDANSVNSSIIDKGVDLVEANNATIDTVSQSVGDEKALFYSPNVSSYLNVFSNVSERGSVMTLNVD